MPKPIAVLISDTHYSINTLELADKAWRMAVDKAAELNVPLIDCGDLTNDKAIMRAEVCNRLIETMNHARNKNVSVVLLVGNHSLCSEKSKEHALNFLSPYVTHVVDTPMSICNVGFFIPYCSNPDDFLRALTVHRRGELVIAHQGFIGANLGHYVKDSSGIDPKYIKDFRVVSGHYHARQDIGTVSYIGNPYTLTFGEAKDPEKGFQVLMDDGSLQFVPTNLRKHVIYEAETHTVNSLGTTFLNGLNTKPNKEDIVWVKVKGSTKDLNDLKKSDVAKLLGREDFKLDKIYTDTPKLEEKTDKMTGEQVLDLLIDQGSDSLEYKAYLKKLWREL